MRSTLKATFAVFTTILMTAVSCNKEIAETQNPLLEKHTCEMKLVGSLVNFDGQYHNLGRRQYYIPSHEFSSWSNNGRGHI